MQFAADLPWRLKRWTRVVVNAAVPSAGDLCRGRGRFGPPSMPQGGASARLSRAATGRRLKSMPARSTRPGVAKSPTRTSHACGSRPARGSTRPHEKHPARAEVSNQLHGQRRLLPASSPRRGTATLTPAKSCPPVRVVDVPLRKFDPFGRVPPTSTQCGAGQAHPQVCLACAVSLERLRSDRSGPSTCAALRRTLKVCPVHWSGCAGAAPRSSSGRPPSVPPPPRRRSPRPPPGPPHPLVSSLRVELRS